LRSRISSEIARILYKYLPLIVPDLDSPIYPDEITLGNLHLSGSRRGNKDCDTSQIKDQVFAGGSLSYLLNNPLERDKLSFLGLGGIIPGERALPYLFTNPCEDTAGYEHDQEDQQSSPLLPLNHHRMVVIRHA